MFADIGYALSSVGYIALILLLLVTGISGGATKVLLLLAAVATAVWSSLHISYLNFIQDASSVLMLDSFKLWVFLLFSLSCLKHKDETLARFFMRRTPIFFMCFGTAVVVLNFIPSIETNWLYVSLMTGALSLLILMEMLYRQSGESKWAFKPLVLYFGIIALFDFVIYANASMVSHLGGSYIQARGFIYLIALPFLVLAIRRISSWGINIYVSRDVVLHSSLLMVAGAYLSLMAIVGYFVKFIGGNWNYSLQLVLVVMSLTILVAVFVSEQFRSQIKVFITKHFYANQFDYRIQWVNLTSALSDQPESQEQMYDSALKGFLTALQLKKGGLYQYKSNKFVLLANQQDSPTLAKLNNSEQHSLVNFMQTTKWIIDFNELAANPSRYDSLCLNDIPQSGSGNQILLPVFQQDILWGAVSLLTNNSKDFKLNWEVRDYLNAVTGQVSNYIFHYQTAEALAQNAQFAAFSRMSAFVLHDLKNVMAQVDLILANSQQHKHNPEFIDDTFETLEYTKIRIAKMLNQLTEKKALNSAVTRTDLVPLASNVIERQCQTQKPIPKLIASDAVTIEIDAEKLSNVLYHLLSNAQQATNDTGQISISIFDQIAYDAEPAEAMIVIKDNGSGMSEEFIATRLFKPFDTTKGNTGMGIGAYDAKHFIEEIGGNITVDSQVDLGTTFTISIPHKRN